jgi:RND family efflux transporter MFP subunit
MSPCRINRRDKCARSRFSGLLSVRGALAALLLCALAACDGSAEKPSTRNAADTGAVSAVASAKGRVDIEGGVIRLAARRDGVIAEVLVEEGAHVKAGQVLATLDDALAQRNLSLAQSEVVQAEVASKQADLELRTARREVARLQPLADEQSVSRQDFDRARDAQSAAEISAQVAHASIRTAGARAAVAARDVEERQIVAPLDGQIIQRQARPGNGVSTLNVTPLFLFVPEVPRIVRAELEEQYLPVVTPGQTAEIVLEADASKRWRGRVLRIGKVVGQRTPSEDPTERQDNRVVEVVIALNDKSLLIGQRVIVRFQKR